MTRRDGLDKIRKKGGPKDYKSGKPGPSGAERLRRRVNSLLVAAERLRRRTPHKADFEYAERLTEALRAFTAAEFARTVPFDVEALVRPSEPHVVGTDPPTPENDPIGRFRRPLQIVDGRVPCPVCQTPADLMDERVWECPKCHHTFVEGSWVCPTCSNSNWREVLVCPYCHTSKPKVDS